MDNKKNIRKKCFAVITLLLVGNILHAQSIKLNDTLNYAGIEIWDKAPHNAFTDLLDYKGYVYCSFREGGSHVPGINGVGKIIRTKDGVNWQDFTTLQKRGIDLRDQKISIMPDGRMICLMGGSVYDTSSKPSKLLGMYPQVAFMGNDLKFSDPEPAMVENPGHHWIWRLSWYKNMAYGVDYGNDKKAKLVKTKDGKKFSKAIVLDIDGAPNESTIRFDKKGKIYLLVRREEGDKMGVLATALPPYQKFDYQKLNYRLGGPDFIFSPDQEKLIIGTRLYLPDGVRTGVLVTGLDGKVQRTIILESGGDCSYPGLLIKNNQLWISYYSSHTGKTKIYFTKISLNNLFH